MDDEYELEWRVLTDKKEIAALSGFQCAADWPTTPGGRRLPQHPRIWEHDAQRHVRNLRQLAKGDDTVWVGVDNSQDPPVTASVLHLRFQQNDVKLAVQLKVGAVAMTHRRKEPPFLGDELMAVAKAEALAAMAERGCSSLVLGGDIHTGNRASMLMAGRNEWEALKSPPVGGGYVPWGRVVT